MNEKRLAAVDQLDVVIEELIHELDLIHVRRRSVQELDAEDQGEIIGTLKPLLPLIRRARKDIDTKLSAILDRKIEES